MEINPDVRLIHGSGFFALVNDKKQSVDYSMNYEKVSIEGKLVLYQSLVWRDKGSAYTSAFRGYSSFAGYVFFEHLFPLSGFVIASDNEQSDDGSTE